MPNDVLTEGGVYGGETSIDDSGDSYEDQVAEAARRINSKLNFIRIYIEGLKSQNQDAYTQYRQEYEEVLHQYNRDLTEARTTGEQSPPEIKKQCIDNLLVILDYTEQTVKAIEATGFNVDTDTLEDATVEPGAMQSGSDLPVPPPSTAMVTHSGEAAQGDGVITAKWKSLSPGWKTALKILGVAGALYGGKYVYDRWLKPERE